MKTMIKMLSIALMIVISSQTLIAQIDGIWQSDSGKKFQVEETNGGFLYRNIANNLVIQTYYLGETNGVPWYRADFTNGSFQLYMIISSNQISTSNSYNPNTINTWTKIRSNGSNQNQSNFNQSSGGYQSGSGGTCSVCNGSGYSNAVIWAPNYTGGSVDDEWCEICKEFRKPHTHKPCTSCGGTGYK